MFPCVGQSKFVSKFKSPEVDHQSNSKYKLTEVKPKFKFYYTTGDRRWRFSSPRLTRRFGFTNGLDLLELSL